MLINVNNAWSYHIVYDYVVYFILFIEPIRITTSSFHEYFELFNKYVGDIYWFLQGTIFINYYEFEWVLLIIHRC